LIANFDEEWKSVVFIPTQWRQETQTVMKTLDDAGGFVFPVNGMAGSYALGFVYVLFLCPYEKLIKVLCSKRGNEVNRNRLKSFVDNALEISRAPVPGWTTDGHYESFGSVLRNALAHNDATLVENSHTVIFSDRGVTINVESPVLAEWADNFAQELTTRLMDRDFRRMLVTEPI